MRLRNSGEKATLMKANLSQKEETNCLFDPVKAEVGELHVLVNNAGISLRRKNGDFGKLEPGQLLKMNLIAPFLCMQRAFPLINSSGGGVIINISSLRAAVSYKSAGIYAATKSTLATLAKIEPLEFGRVKSEWRRPRLYPHRYAQRPLPEELQKLLRLPHWVELAIQKT